VGELQNNSFAPLIDLLQNGLYSYFVGSLKKENMGAKKKNVDMSSTEMDIKIVKAEENSEVTPAEAETTEKTEEKAVKPKKTTSRVRGRKYQAVRAKIDRTKKYDLETAIELLKKTSYVKFDATVEAAFVLKDIGTTVNVSLPHSTGITVKVAIVTPELLTKIEAGEIDFDVLVSGPEFMPKLAKFARVLGPKGLMPNPKNGTLTTNPEQKKKELEAGAFTLKTEKKAPLMHLGVGKVSMKNEDLVENVQALLKVLKGKLVKLSISSSMGPGIKVEVEK
jgi:large subunit ribosomal protein L1